MQMQLQQRSPEDDGLIPNAASHVTTFQLLSTNSIQKSFLASQPPTNSHLLQSIWSVQWSGSINSCSHAVPTQRWCSDALGSLAECKFQPYIKSLPFRRQYIRKLNTSLNSHKLHWHAKLLLMQTALLQATPMPQLRGSISNSSLSLSLLPVKPPTAAQPGTMPGTPFATAKRASATMNKPSRRNAGPFCGRGRCQRYAMLAMATPGARQ